MLTREWFKGKRVTVFGLGHSGGVGTVEFLAKLGARDIVVTDIKTKEELQSSIDKLIPYKNLTFVLGQHRPEDFSHTDLVVKNPLIPWTNEYVKLAEKQGIPVEMDSSIFFALLPKVPVIGITGTKGKTTTASLLVHLLKTAKRLVVPVGIGQVGVLDQLDRVTKESLVVFELSSWRLSALHRLKKSPTLSIVTNLLPDHLNYYKAMEAYGWDKEAIFAYQRSGDQAIFNALDPLTHAMSTRAPGKKYFFGTEDFVGDGVFLRDEEAYFRSGEEESVLFSYTSVKLIGEHNRGNVLAAACAAKLLGLTAAEIEAGVKSFGGVAHRLEFVASINAVDYINDSAATIPNAAVVALEAIDRPVILIAGGSDKKLPLEPFAEALARKTKDLVLFKGSLTERLVPLLKQRLPDKDLMIVDSMAGAVRAASRLARPGDAVLLSPGATSFGLFKNEFDRGDQFKAAVAELES